MKNCNRKMKICNSIIHRITIIWLLDIRKTTVRGHIQKEDAIGRKFFETRAKKNNELADVRFVQKVFMRVLPLGWPLVPVVGRLQENILSHYNNAIKEYIYIAIVQIALFAI